MEINKVNSVSFQRKPNAMEMRIYTHSLKEGLNLLNKKVDIIIHNSSAPAIARENTGIGSLFSRTSLEKFFPFLRSQAITGIQQEPNYFRKSGDFSPYSPESSAKNIFAIPLEKLTTEEYEKILPKESFYKIVMNNPNKNYVDYSYIPNAYEQAIKEAFHNLKDGSKLKQDFLTFKEIRGEELERYAIFRILDKIHQKDWPDWDGIDRVLYSPSDKNEIKLANTRIKELKKEHQDEIDRFIFAQMLVEREHINTNKLANANGIAIIGDSPVATPSADEWINQNLFIDNMALGCPPDYFSKEGQRWGFRYFKPEEIFNEDGTLGKAGLILKKKYEDYFRAFPGGLRIDHIIGLIDPFLYTTTEKILPHNSGRIFSQEGKYKKETVEEYANILTKIILPAAEKFGISKDSIICEDLGAFNAPTRKVMEQFQLPGIAVTQYDGYRGAEIPQKNTIMIGSHDNVSFLEFADQFFKDKKNKYFLSKTKHLMEDTVHKGSTKAEQEWYLGEIRGDKKKFLSACFAELFTSPAKRVQIFFTDFFGISKTYNKPGTTEGNWALRLDENFENNYYKAVSEGKAPNLPLAIATALRHRGLIQGNEKLLEQLDSSAKILAEA
ncbi:4-alpha-glucanotransferase [bacterium]|nr:4-alpha-glucanotransferase [bacterium]